MLPLIFPIENVRFKSLLAMRSIRGRIHANDDT